MTSGDSQLVWSAERPRPWLLPIQNQYLPDLLRCCQRSGGLRERVCTASVRAQPGRFAGNPRAEFQQARPKRITILFSDVLDFRLIAPRLVSNHIGGGYVGAGERHDPQGLFDAGSSIGMCEQRCDETILVLRQNGVEVGIAGLHGLNRRGEPIIKVCLFKAEITSRTGSGLELVPTPDEVVRKVQSCWNDVDLSENPRWHAVDPTGFVEEVVLEPTYVWTPPGVSFCVPCRSLGCNGVLDVLREHRRYRVFGGARDGSERSVCDRVTEIDFHGDVRVRSLSSCPEVEVSFTVLPLTAESFLLQSGPTVLAAHALYPPWLGPGLGSTPTEGEPDLTA
ncbi:hypothetical protein CALCODRAFT_505111 [Calocera cornea HHB12733]|uniref:Uncharacterized protein n=1 Tax=Calocera cornea HHB12733 TaxID=1353952 RepID=A0A165C0I0_9BASI|nr:hypothetical protein CALCODRAFT_505111 [Calocera cornea HHB12733]